MPSPITPSSRSSATIACAITEERLGLGFVVVGRRRAASRSGFVFARRRATGSRFSPAEEEEEGEQLHLGLRKESGRVRGMSDFYL